jgi:hypothetical protein
MWIAFFAFLHLVAPGTEGGLFKLEGIYLMRVSALEVPDHPKLFGNSTLRVDEVLIGPNRLKGSTAIYKFFTPSGELDGGGGARYSGEYPHFASPAPRGRSRYWWGSAQGAVGWKTSDFRKVTAFLPTQASELLLRADLKGDSKEAADQKELVEAIVKLESKRSRLLQIVFLKEIQKSRNQAVYLTADRILDKLTRPPKKQ